MLKIIKGYKKCKIEKNKFKRFELKRCMSKRHTTLRSYEKPCGNLVESLKNIEISQQIETKDSPKDKKSKNTSLSVTSKMVDEKGLVTKNSNFLKHRLKIKYTFKFDQFTK